MSTFVLDCSIAISWLFEDEASPETDGLMEQLQDDRALARTETLTTYDAAYLELAIRRGVPLATRDGALIRAANRVTVKTLPA